MIEHVKCAHSYRLDGRCTWCGHTALEYIAELEAENKRLRAGVSAALRGVCDGRNELTELLWPDTPTTEGSDG